MRSGWQSETNLNILVSTIHPPWSSALFLMQISNIWILNISQIFIVQCNQYLLARTTLMDWRIIGRSHQLTWRREILGGEGKKYLEEKERNTWRGRREILGGEGGENSFSTRKRRQFQDQWGDPVWCTKTYFNEYIGDIFCYMLLYIYSNVYRYILIYVTVHVNIYICVEVKAHYVCGAAASL